MPDSRHLHFLEKLEAEKCEAHAVQLARAVQALDTAEAQLAQLKQYESGYHAQLSGKLANVIAIDALRGHHRFMQNIAHAVRQQDVEVARRRAAVEAARRVWQAVERRRQGFLLMANKADQADRRDEERRSQKLGDELTANKFARTTIDP